MVYIVCVLLGRTLADGYGGNGLNDILADTTMSNPIIPMENVGAYNQESGSNSLTDNFGGTGLNDMFADTTMSNPSFQLWRMLELIIKKVGLIPLLTTMEEMG